MKIIECEQRSEEWYSARLGIPTSSNFDKIVMVNGKPSKSRTKYLYQLAGEHVAGVAEETYQSAAMLKGIEREDEARNLYEVINDVEVQQVGFCVDNDAGCSPDGLIGEKGGLEIKCPIASTHVNYLLNNTLLKDYFQQVQGSLLVTKREWWDVMSYYPGIKPLIVRVKRDETFIMSLKVELKMCCNELKEIINKIK